MAKGKPQPALNKRRAARFAAVQALYQAEAGDLAIDRVIAELDRVIVAPPRGKLISQTSVDHRHDICNTVVAGVPADDI